MKKSIVILTFIIPFITLAQYDDGFLKESFFDRQPSTRSEALGKAYASIEGDLSSIFYNPAGTATLKGLELYSSFASPLYTAEDAYFNFISAGYNFNKYLTVGFSRNHFSLETDILFTDENGNSKTSRPQNTFYTLNLSSEPIKNWFIGLNTNYMIWEPIDQSFNTLFLDFGIIKKFEIGDSENQSLNIGTSITNLNFAKIELNYNNNTHIDTLPVISRIGANYNVFLDRNYLFDTLHTFSFLAQAEYKFLLNSQYQTGFHSGLEVGFLEMLFLRMGYYYENHNDYGFPDSNVDHLSEITYGFGIQVPLSKLTKIPLNIAFDYTSLPQPSYSKINTDWDNFTSYSFRVNWVINNHSNNNETK